MPALSRHSVVETYLFYELTALLLFIHCSFDAYRSATPSDAKSDNHHDDCTCSHYAFSLLATLINTPNTNSAAIITQPRVRS